MKKLIILIVITSSLVFSNESIARTSRLTRRTVVVEKCNCNDSLLPLLAFGTLAGVVITMQKNNDNEQQYLVQKTWRF